MSNSGKQSKLGAIVLGSYMLLGISTASIAETQLTVENDGLALTAIVSSSKDILSTSIRVVGPDGFVFEDRFEDSTLQWIPEGDLADGRYHWETWTVTVTPGAPMRQINAPQASAPDTSDVEGAGESSATPANPEQPAVEIPIERYFEEADKRVHTESGSFEVRDGWMVPSLDEEDAISRLEPASPGLIGSIASAIGDFLFPAAHAEECTSPCTIPSGGVPELQMTSDTNGNFGGPHEFEAEVTVFGEFQIGSVVGAEPFKILSNAADTNSFVINSQGNIGLGTSTPTDPIHIVDIAPIIRFQDTNDAQDWKILAGGGGYRVEDDTTGNVPFLIETGARTDSIRIGSFGSVGIAGSLGIGTNSPSAPLDITGSAPRIRLSDTDASGEIIVDDDAFPGSLVTGDSMRFRVPANSTKMSLTDEGRLSLGGFFAPEFSLDILSTSGDGQVRITETAGSNGLTMFALENTGHPRFRLRNSTLNSNWDFRTAGSGSSEQFQITNISGGSSSFLMRLFKSGDMEVEGDITANGVLLTSTREAKTDFAPLDERDVLERLASLEISQWRYKHESEDTVHFGPVAEEFHETFGLSDGKHLNMIDTNGIAFAAIKALNTQNQTLNTQNQKLNVQNQKLSKENEDIMRRLDALESKFEL